MTDPSTLAVTVNGLFCAVEFYGEFSGGFHGIYVSTLEMWMMILFVTFRYFRWETTQME